MTVITMSDRRFYYEFCESKRIAKLYIYEAMNKNEKVTILELKPEHTKPKGQAK